MSQPTETGLTPPVGEYDHIRGAPGAPVTLVEYGDFECPDTVGAYRYVKALLRQNGDQIRFAYRHYPLVKSHPHARAAAEASEAAADQGKFWELHDRLFERPYELQRKQLIGHARALGLDVE